MFKFQKQDNILFIVECQLRQEYEWVLKLYLESRKNVSVGAYEDDIPLEMQMVQGS